MHVRCGPQGMPAPRSGPVTIRSSRHYRRMDTDDAVPYLRNLLDRLEREHDDMQEGMLDALAPEWSKRICNAIREAHSAISVHVDKALEEGLPDRTRTVGPPQVDFFRVSERRAVRLTMGRLDEYTGNFEVLRWEGNTQGGWQQRVDNDWIVELTGFVRFDGCSNWTNQGTGCQVHFCDGAEEADEVALCLKVAHGLVAQHMGVDGWDDYRLPPQWGEVLPPDSSGGAT